MFEDDGTARTKLLNHLGFTLPPEVNETTEDDLSHDMNSLIHKENVVKEAYLGDNGKDFFNNLPSPKTDTPVSTSVNNFGAEELIKESESLDDTADFSFHDAVQRALVVGDCKGAVAQCISANKMADALVIAQAGGASLWETTRDQYHRKSSSPYLMVVAATWKETLTLLCTFAHREDWTLLCDTLASLYS